MVVIEVNMENMYNPSAFGPYMPDIGTPRQIVMENSKNGGKEKIPTKRVHAWVLMNLNGSLLRQLK